MSSSPIRVLIVDDSATVRKILSSTFSADPDIEVVGTAIDPFDARGKITKYEPDVITLDLELPKMDGLTFLKIVMKQRPMPVIILSSISSRGTAVALEALRSGAFDVFGKPASLDDLKDLEESLCLKVKEAGWARRHNTWQHRVETNKTASPFTLRHGQQTKRLSWRQNPDIQPKHLLLVGASTGGTEAISKMLSKMPPQLPPVLVVQHIPARFSHSFAIRLEAECAMAAKEAEHGETAKAGCIYVAPGGKHMTAKWSNGHYVIHLDEGPAIWHQRPAVDILFKSFEACAGPHMVATLLTGMGRDGAEGLKSLRNKGARCFAQSEDSCVVFGMPKAAQDAGAPEKMVDIKEMSQTILQAFEDNFNSPNTTKNRLDPSSKPAKSPAFHAAAASHSSTRPPFHRTVSR